MLYTYIRTYHTYTQIAKSEETDFEHSLL